MRVNAERLNLSLIDMAHIGATPSGGVSRVALTASDLEGRRKFLELCEREGCAIRIDKIGNIFARRNGSSTRHGTVLVGSHLDTQPFGGKFDGALGVMAGLEIIRTLNDSNTITKRAIEIAVWTNEEGSRFAPAMLGSGVAAGVLTLAEALASTDMEGISLKDELEKSGFLGHSSPRLKDIVAAYELHIEQGPILEKDGAIIGVVTGAQGLKWFDICIYGQAAHAGTTPMNMRDDALVTTAALISSVQALAKDFAPAGRGTVGHLVVAPNSRNTIPGQVKLTVDLRHPENSQLELMEKELSRLITALGNNRATYLKVLDEPATEFDTTCVDAIRAIARECGLSHQDICSGACHDSVFISRVAPTGMIFIPCRNGLSHNEAEAADPMHIGFGCEVLYRAVLRAANT